MNTHAQAHTKDIPFNHKNSAVIHGCIMTLFSPSDDGMILVIVTTTSQVKAKEIKIDHKILINTKFIPNHNTLKPGSHIAIEGPLTQQGHILAETCYNASETFTNEEHQSKNYITLYGTIEDKPKPFRHGHLFTVATRTTSNGMPVNAKHLILAAENHAHKINAVNKGDYVWVEGPLSIDKKIILSHLSVMETPRENSIKQNNPARRTIR